MTSLTNGRMSRRWAAAVLTGVAVLMAAVSTASACTMIMGITKVSNPKNGSWIMIDKQGLKSGPGVSGGRGKTLKVMAWELPPGSEYVLWFIWPASVQGGTGCHEVDTSTGTVMNRPSGVPITDMKADFQGSLDSDPTLDGAQAYKAVIPNDPRAVTNGTAQICGREIPPWKSQYEAATQHVKLTIL